jgi:CheY-like chemotaxis protein
MRKYKIIIVENDEDERFFMLDSFNELGLFDIAAMVANGNELFEWLDANSANLPDLILSDLNMPGKNGYDIIQHLKAHEAYKRIPIVITSTSSAQIAIDKCLELGADDYMPKPDTFIEYGPFIENLHKLIEGKSL